LPERRAINLNVNKLPSCIIDGEAVCCDDDGRPSFERIRYRQHDAGVFLYAFDLIEFSAVMTSGVSRSMSARPRYDPCWSRRDPACDGTSTSRATETPSSATPASSA
jgi:hypothetical protein